MGLFNGYTKPGPGINKNAPKKKGIFLFFELLKRKFFNLMKINMLHMIVSIPMLAIFFFISFSIFMGGLSTISGGAELSTITDVLKDSNVDVLPFIAMILNVLFVLWGSGPASAALAYILRCFTREKHAWLWSDFWDKFKENFKQAIIVCVIDIVVIILATNAIMFYYGQYLSNQSTMYMILSYISILLLIIYTFMHFYIYQFMITFENKLRDIYRNALILALGKAPMNLLISVISIIIAIIAYNFITPVVAFLLSFLLLNGLARFVIEFYAARTIEKLIPNDNSNDVEEESIFSDEIKYNEVSETPISFN